MSRISMRTRNEDPRDCQSHKYITYITYILMHHIITPYEDLTPIL